MSKWVWKGLTTGKPTTRYPAVSEEAAGVSSGLPDFGRELPVGCCPEATGSKGAGVRGCVHCFRCLRQGNEPASWQQGYEWATLANPEEDPSRKFSAAFGKSLHIRVVDAGACGACLSEMKQTGKPHYNIHRLGFFITPTPRQADVLLVMGPVSDNMVMALLKTYEAMPEPKKVVAAGTCALTGGVFGRGFCCRGGAAEVIPVDVEIPGCPPPPLAIIHGLLVAVGRRPPVAAACQPLPSQKREP